MSTWDQGRSAALTYELERARAELDAAYLYARSEQYEPGSAAMRRLQRAEQHYQDVRGRLLSDTPPGPTGPAASGGATPEDTGPDR